MKYKRGNQGVAIILEEQHIHKVLQVKQINRINENNIISRKESRSFQSTVYAPQEGCSNEEKEKFLYTLEDGIKKSEDTIIVANVNTQVVKDWEGYKNILEAHGTWPTNEETEDVLDMYQRNNLVFGNTE